MDTQLLLTEILGNTIQDYSWFIGAVLLGFIFKKLISKYLSHLLFKVLGKKGVEVGIDKFDKLLTKPIGFCIMLSVIYLGSTHINYPEVWDLVSKKEFGLKMLISRGFSLIYVYSIFWIILKVIDFIANCGMARVFAYLMEDNVEMTDIAIFADTSNCIKNALIKSHSINNSKTNISKTAFEIALKQLV